MTGNTVDIIIRAVDKGVRATFTKVSGSISKSGTALDAFNKSMGRTNKVASAMSGAMQAAFVGLGVGAVTQQLWDAGTQAQRLGLAFEAISGSTSGAKDELVFVREEADRLGLVFYSTAEAYKAMFAAGTAGNLDLKVTRGIFTGFSEAFAALGLNADQVEGSFRAIGQMMGKNKVLAEELRTQLGEKLPNAVKFFANAAGVSVAEFEKMMANGEVGVEVISRTAELYSQEFAKKAEEAAGMAVGALARWKTAWWDLKVILSNSGFLDSATSYLKELTAAMNDPEVQASLKIWAQRFFDMADAVIRFVWEWKGFIAAALGLRVIVGIGFDLVKVITALNVAFSVLTGLSFVSWGGSVVAALQAVQLQAMTTTAALGAAAGATLALVGGYALGKKIAEWQYFSDAVKANSEALAEVPGKFAAITNATGVTIKSFADLDKAQADGLIKFNNVTGAWEKAAAVAQKSNKSQQQSVKEATDEMKKQYESYAKLVQKLQDEIAGKQESLTQKLRSMSREGMSDLSAWKDQRAEAEEYYAAAQKAIEAGREAAAAGDQALAKEKYDEAKKAAEQAQESYENLSNTVEQNDRVVIGLQQGLRVRMDGVKDSGDLAIEAMQELEKATSNAARKLDEATGGALAAELPEIAKAFGEVDVMAEDLVKKSVEFDNAWKAAWDGAVYGGKEAVAMLEKELTELTKDRHIKVYVEEVVKKHVGGMVQKLHSGGFPRLRGKLPGSDGPDRIRALLAPGEFIMRSAAVRKYGAGLFQALNSMRFNIGDMLKTRLTASLPSVRLPSPQPVRMFGGGPVPAQAMGGNTYHLNASFVGEVSQASRQTGRQNARMIMNELEKMHRGSSK